LAERRESFHGHGNAERVAKKDFVGQLRATIRSRLKRLTTKDAKFTKEDILAPKVKKRFFSPLREFVVNRNF